MSDDIPIDPQQHQQQQQQQSEEEKKTNLQEGNETKISPSRKTSVSTKMSRKSIRKTSKVSVNSPNQKPSTPPSPQPNQNTIKSSRKTRATVVDNSGTKSPVPSKNKNATDTPNLSSTPNHKKSISTSSSTAVTRNSILQKSLPVSTKSQKTDIISSKIIDDDVMSEVSDVTSPVDLMGDILQQQQHEQQEQQIENEYNNTNNDENNDYNDYNDYNNDEYDDIENVEDNEESDYGDNEDNELNKQIRKQSTKIRSFERGMSAQSTESATSSHHFSESDQSMNYNPVSSVSVVYGQQKNEKYVLKIIKIS